ncbi:SDR family NAD(P)-dependent oxidoreductase [Kocuria sabuli]|uniref:SDR family NAD(P)-dependent oxidoreductase n=1 Tax=Kocuria sabuli TaxID=3071448 RepID=UPI0034D4D40D
MSTKLTVVTGGGRGIGAAISRRLVAAGHDQVITYRRDRAAAENVADQVRRSGRRALTVPVEMTDPGSVAEPFDRVASFGALTGLVNNAGAATAVGPLETNDLESIRRDLEVNLFGVIACTQQAIGPLKKAGGGAVVNISSVAASLGGPGTYVHYAAAKAGVEAFTVGLAKELAAENIRINAGAPGTVWTDFHRYQDRPAKVAATIPMGRAGRPEEIARAVAWLLSEDASYTTGTTLRVTGGL